MSPSDPAEIIKKTNDFCFQGDQKGTLGRNGLMFTGVLATPLELITAQKMKFSITDFFSKCDQICSFLRIWSHLLKKSLMQNFIFCAVNTLLRLVKVTFTCKQFHVYAKIVSHKLFRHHKNVTYSHQIFRFLGYET